MNTMTRTSLRQCASQRTRIKKNRPSVARLTWRYLRGILNECDYSLLVSWRAVVERNLQYAYSSIYA